MGPLDILRILPYNENSSNKSLAQVQYPSDNARILDYLDKLVAPS